VNTSTADLPGNNSPPGWITVSRSRDFLLPPRRLWLHLTNSNRFNRLAGFPSLDSTLTRDSFDLNLPGGEFRLLGLRLSRQWDPRIEWVEPFWFERERAISFGPIARLINRFELTEVEGGSRANALYRVEPRSGWNGVVRLGAPLVARTIERFFDQLERLVAMDAPAIGSGTVASQPNRSRLQKSGLALQQRGFRPDLTEQLLAAIARDPDDALERMRPLNYASRWNAHPRDVVALFLEGAAVGLLDLNWEVVCPNCRGVVSKSGDLAQLVNDYHCESCRLNLTADFDEAVEVTFSPSDEIRRVAKKSFCYGYPALTPHVTAQLRLEPGGSRQIEDIGDERLIGWAAPMKVRQELGLAGGGGRLTLHEDRFSVEPDATNDGWRVMNQSGRLVLVQLQRSTAHPDALTAGRLTSLQEFRDRFSAQLLAPGVTFAIRHLTFLFTDLRGSTAMYAEMGDAPAFKIVREHFNTIRAAIVAAEGGIVKTIGDAVMAVFSDAGAGLRAAIAMQEAFAGTGLVVKIGLHSGPSIAITQNEVLDYFGTTVNTAARIQATSRGGDVVMSDECYRLAGGEASTTSWEFETTLEHLTLKGLPFPVAVRRIRRARWMAVPGGI